MNDISVKTVESPRDQVPGSPSTLSGAEPDFDPLAIEEDVGTIKPPQVEEPAVEKVGEESAGNCDDNAKEKIVSESQNEGKEVMPVQTEIETDEVKQPSPAPETIETIEKTDKTENTEVTEPEITESLPTKEAQICPETPPLPEEPAQIPEQEVPPQEIEQQKEIEQEIQQKEIEPIPKPIENTPPVPEILPKDIILEKEPSPVKEVVENKVADVEMTEVMKEDKIEQKIEHKPKAPMNGDIIKDDKGTKRRSSEEIETESPLKKLCQEVEKTFPQHDMMIQDYIQTATKNNVDEIQRHTEQLLAEIQTLRELAQKKEHEWNNILHLKKVKEEILLRLLRRKQVISFEKAPEINGQDPFDYLNQAKNLAIDKSDEISGLALKQPGSGMPGAMMQAPIMPVTSHFNPMAGLPPPYDKAHLQSMPKPVFPQMFPGHMPGFPRDMNAMNGQMPAGFGLPMGRQGPTKDVKSIIADYRQRNPEVAPRRGRRMKSILNPNMMNAPRPIAPKVDMNNLSNLNMIFNNLDMNQKAMLERLQQIQAGGLQNGMSFKDVLVQFANMQQNNPGLIPNRPMDVPTRPDIRPEGRRRPERTHEEHKPERLASPSPRLPPPPPYPEISLLPVTTSQETTPTQQQNSLLHGILTKQGSPATQSFSPTLAKLLTSPERKQGATPLPTFGQAKNCGEITITPVQPTPPPVEPTAEKTEEVVQLDDEESPTSEPSASPSPSGSGCGGGRLVIDESTAGSGETESETPLCQGCRRRDAQFVCAGCANQWYCSRDCQVAAWDEHSEMCSG